MKLKNRKFLVWVAWALFTLGSLILTKTIDPSIVTWFGTVSVIYIGGNAASKFAQVKGDE